MARTRRDPIVVGGISIAAGEHRTVDIPVSPLYTHDDLSISVQVIHGSQPGPVVFICAAIHGDEINGVEIIRRVLKHRSLRTVRGTLLAIPIVNVYGFLHHSRYLPDGRDLNRSFPGSEAGSLAARVAARFCRKSCSSATTASTCTPAPGTGPTTRRSVPTSTWRAPGA